MTSTQVIRPMSFSAGRQEVVWPSKRYRTVPSYGILLGTNLPSSLHHLAVIYELYYISLKSVTSVYVSASSVYPNFTNPIIMEDWDSDSSKLFHSRSVQVRQSYPPPPTSTTPVLVVLSTPVVIALCFAGRVCGRDRCEGQLRLRGALLQPHRL